MAIKLKTQELNQITGEKVIRFEIIAQKQISSNDIAFAIEKETGIPAIEVMTVLRSFYWRASVELLNGRGVDIPDFGSLQPKVAGTKKTGPSLKVIFRSKGNFRKCQTKLEFEEVEVEK